VKKLNEKIQCVSILLGTILILITVLSVNIIYVAINYQSGRKDNVTLGTNGSVLFILLTSVLLLLNTYHECAESMQD
jgi:hypothetical protein